MRSAESARRWKNLYPTRESKTLPSPKQTQVHNRECCPTTLSFVVAHTVLTFAFFLLGYAQGKIRDRAKLCTEFGTKLLWIQRASFDHCQRICSSRETGSLKDIHALIKVLPTPKGVYIGCAWSPDVLHSYVLENKTVSL